MIFVGQIVPYEERLSRDISMAAQIYQGKFIEFTRPLLILSIVPVFIREPYHEQIGNIYFINRGKSARHLIFHITKLIGDTFAALNLIRENRKEKVWFYNLTKSTFLTAFFTKYILRRKIYIVIADYSRPVSWGTRLVDRMIRQFNGALVLNSNITIVKNKCVMPGLLRESEIILPDIKPFSKKILLSGSLGYTTGLDFALHFFSRYKTCELYITGVCYGMPESEFKQLLEKYKDCTHIHFMGKLSYDHYREVLRECDICLSLRDPYDSQHDYNFPSKILEYLSFNKFVISTRPYSDIPEGLLFISEKTEAGMKDILDKIYNMNPDMVREKKNYIFNQLVGNFSSSALLSMISKLEQ